MGIVYFFQGIFFFVFSDLKSELVIIVSFVMVILGSDSKVDWEGMVVNYD